MSVFKHSSLKLTLQTALPSWSSTTLCMSNNPQYSQTYNA